MATDIVRLASQLTQLKKENDELRKKLLEINHILVNNNEILEVFYKSVANTANMTEMYTYLETGLTTAKPFEEYRA